MEIGCGQSRKSYLKDDFGPRYLKIGCGRNWMSQWKMTSVQIGSPRHLVIGCGINWKSHWNMACVTDGSRIFLWSKEMLERMGTVDFANVKDLEASPMKQLRHMPGYYLCELGYDLALSPGDNNV